MKGRQLFFWIILFILPVLNAAPITIGVRSYYPPFDMIIDQKKQVSGFDVNLMTEICKRNKMDCNFIAARLDDLFKNVQSGTFTLAVGALIITEERERSFLFSLPYLASSGQFVTLASNDINTISDACGKRIGSIIGSIYSIKAQEQCKGTANISEYPHIADAYAALSARKIDVIITDERGAKYWVANSSGVFRLVGYAIPTGTGYAIMAGKGQDELIKTINKTLIDMENDGTYMRLYKIYF